ncbi:hypothetical protein Hdeb2414_s0003g00087111 [Helianthus debilis subsp. tardiflorus]
MDVFSFTCKELKPLAGLFTPTKQRFPLPPNHITAPGRFRCLHNTCNPEPTATLCTASILLFPQIVSILKHRIVKIASIMCCLCGERKDYGRERKDYNREVE